MKLEEMVKILRRYSGDTEGKIWSDAELSDFLLDAVKAYSTDTGCFRRVFSFYPDADGKYKFPEDYLYFITGWNSDGNKIEAMNRREVLRYYPERDQKDGEAEYIYSDMDTPLGFRLCPNPAERQHSEEIEGAEDYGVVLTDDYGTAYEEEYGVLRRLIRFDFRGDVLYCREGKAEEVIDYMALIYHGCVSAFSADTDFADSDKANWFRERYRERSARFRQARHGLTGKPRGGVYY